MGKKRKIKARVLSQRMIAPEIYDMWLATDMAKEAGAGQFVGVYPENGAYLLPRPISICEVDEEKTALRIVYRVSGAGTGEFATWKPGAECSLLGVLGNGFPILEGKRAILMGGGIGIPPMLQLFKELSLKGNQVTAVLGYRDRELFLAEDFKPYGQVLIATEDGSVGIRGNVVDAVESHGIEGDVIMACGPMPMLRAIKGYAGKKQMDAYISLEERMACGVGACLGCVCRTVHKDGHSHVNNARICTDGPVFEAREVDI